MLTEEEFTNSALPRNTWLVTFADVIALLLVFFVMLFSMSEIKTETWNVIRSHISSPETLKKADKPRTYATKNVGTVTIEEALSLQYLANVLEEHLSADPLLNTSLVHRLDGLVVVQKFCWRPSWLTA